MRKLEKRIRKFFLLKITSFLITKKSKKKFSCAFVQRRTEFQVKKGILEADLFYYSN